MSWMISFIYEAINITLFSMVFAAFAVLFMSLFKSRLTGRIVAMNIKFYFIFLTILLFANIILCFYYVFCGSFFLQTLPLHITDDMLVIVYALLTIWLAGIVFNVFPYIFSFMIFNKKINSLIFLNEIKDREVIDLLVCIKNEMNIRGKVRILEMKGLPSPAIFRLHHPIILLPENVTDSTELKVIFAHELAHIKNRDLLYKPLGKLLSALFWFNPIIFITAKLLNQYTEFTCDEMACSLGKKFFSMKDYFETILKFKKKHTAHNSFLATLSENSSDIERRICNMKKFVQISHHSLTSITVTSILVMTLCMTFSLHVSAQTLNVFDNVTGKNDTYIEQEIPPYALQEQYVADKRKTSDKEIPIPYIGDTIEINITASPDDVYSTVDFYKHEGESVKLSLSFNPDDKDIKAGLYTPNGSVYVISSSGINYTFDITQDGYYAVFLENVSDADVSVVGFAHINN